MHTSSRGLSFGLRSGFAVALCASAIGLSSAKAATAPGMVPDVIYYGGKIVTNDPAMETVEAVAIAKGAFVARGPSAEIRALAGPQTRQVNLGGKTALPGFYDNHVHIGVSDDDPRQMDWNHINSKEALLAAIAKRAAEVKPGEWILASLKNENMPQARLPMHWEVEKVAPNNPVAMRRGHIVIVNTTAMKIAGIDDKTPQPPGGAIEHDAEGKAMGWFREGAGHRLIMKHVPPAPPPPDAVAEKELHDQISGLLKFGITSFNVAGMRPSDMRWVQETYEKWGMKLPRATVQLRLYPGYDQHDNAMEGAEISVKELEALGFKTGFGNDRLKLGAVKVSIDGGFSAAAIMTIDPYPTRNDNYHGVDRIPEDALYRVVKRANELNWQLGIHAMGDGAIKRLVDVYARVLEEHPRENARIYVHHLSVLPPEETLAKMEKYKIAVASQPNFSYSLGPYNARPALTPAKLETNNPQASLLKHNLVVGYGSDMMPIGPLTGIYAAVTRRGVDGKIYGAGEKVSLKQAIWSYTLGSSWLTFDEKTRGSVEVGKVGDLVVLGQDIMTIDPEKIKEIPIEMTIVGGEPLYVRGGARP